MDPLRHIAPKIVAFKHASSLEDKKVLSVFKSATLSAPTLSAIPSTSKIAVVDDPGTELEIVTALGLESLSVSSRALSPSAARLKTLDREPDLAGVDEFYKIVDVSKPLCVPRSTALKP